MCVCIKSFLAIAIVLMAIPIMLTSFACRLRQLRRVVRWFWAIVEGFSSEEINALLQFTCGTSHVPVGGFSSLSPPFSICLLENAKTNSLPKAHTCFNTLALPSTVRIKSERQPFESVDTLSSLLMSLDSFLLFPLSMAAVRISTVS